MNETSKPIRLDSELFPRGVSDLFPVAGHAKGPGTAKRPEMKRPSMYKRRQAGPYISHDHVIGGLFSDLKEIQKPTRFLSADRNGIDFKTALIHMISHELRTPFSVIQSSAELLVMQQGRSNTDEQLVTDQASNIIQEVTHVTELLNRMVLFSRMDTGTLTEHIEQINPVEITQKTMNVSFLPWKDGRDATMIYSGTPRMVSMDPVLFELVLRNLLSNAFKYSAGQCAPEVHVRFFKSKWTLSVKDYGIGIPAKDLVNLTKPYSRGSNVDKIPGMGLGLMIVQYVVNSFHGTLSIRSVEGKGTTITAAWAE